ncbi:MAG: endonuclease/exonuclease/phosphatase family protein [Planctomycetota bacterium]
MSALSTPYGVRAKRALCALLLVLGACGGTRIIQPEHVEGTGPAPPEDGVLEVVTLNVAGLPEFATDREPSRDHVHIGPKLAGFDLVLVQEDFWHHDVLVAGIAQAWRAATRDRFLLPGDGLARFSWLELGPVEHVPWDTAHGFFKYMNDRLASKGFSAGRAMLAPGRTVTVYNVHADAGWHDGDEAARARQFEQLAEHIAENVLEGEAIIVAGDFNTGPTGLSALRAATGLRDVFEDLGVDGGIDRVLYRSGSDVRLTPVEAGRVADFRAPDGGSLSDHTPVRAVFEVELVAVK